jgi:hypothetical protein
MNSTVKSLNLDFDNFLRHIDHPCIGVLFPWNLVRENGEVPEAVACGNVLDWICI